MEMLVWSGAPVMINISDSCIFVTQKLNWNQPWPLAFSAKLSVFDSLSVNILKACVFSTYLSGIDSRPVVISRSVVNSRSAVSSRHSVEKFPARKNQSGSEMSSVLQGTSQDEPVRAFWSMVQVGSTGGSPTQGGR